MRVFYIASVCCISLGSSDVIRGEIMTNHNIVIINIYSLQYHNHYNYLLVLIEIMFVNNHY